MTTPANIPIAILQGSTFEDFLEYTDEDGTPIDLTGCKARMQIRTEIDSDEVQAVLIPLNSGLAWSQRNAQNNRHSVLIPLNSGLAWSSKVEKTLA